MPYTHQEANAKILAFTQSAAVLMREGATSENLFRIINHLNFNPNTASALSANIGRLMPQDAAVKIAKLILKDE